MHDKAKENNQFIQEFLPKAFLFGITFVIMGTATYFVLKPKALTPTSAAVLQEEVSSYQAKAESWMAKSGSELASGLEALSSMLEKRQEDLEAIADDMDDLLYSNAEKSLDFCAQESATLLSRYHAMNARYTIDIANQIHLLHAQVLQKNDTELSQSFWKLMSDLGCQSFTSEQLKIVKQVVELEQGYKDQIQNLAKSKSLIEIQKHLEDAELRLGELQKNGYAQIFMQVSLLQSELAPAVEKALHTYFSGPHAVFGTEQSPEAKSLLQAILSKSGINESHWLSEFDTLVKGHKVVRQKQTVYTSSLR